MMQVTSMGKTFTSVARLFGASLGRTSNHSNSRKSIRSKLSVKTSSQRLANKEDTLARGENIDLGQSPSKTLSPARRSPSKRVNSAKQRAAVKKLREYYQSLVVPAHQYGH